MEFSDLQPTIQWLKTPGSKSTCHPGLEYLTQINQLLVGERFDLLQVNSHFANNKTYDIKNNRGQRLFFAEEKCNCFLRYLCGPQRPLTMTIYDNSGQDVIKMHKTLGCSCCWANYYLQKLKVIMPPGETIGYVYQLCHPFSPEFIIKDKNKEAIMIIRGPCTVFSYLNYLTFHILSLDEEMVIGKISNQMNTLMEGLNASDGKFGVQFPFDLDAKIKALILGASFLIDCMYFKLWC
ncbi:phospholipid scramblase 2-like isoform X2 [Erinaceus europaeus]|nr:phospholipid scramblase 2-like isoform X2 [Erinaceus europaeus]